MSKERFQVGKKPTIVVTGCQGDLVVRPWMELDVRAKGDYTVEELAEELVFEAAGDLVLNVPEGAGIHIKQGQGDVVIRSISGDVSLQEVLGDLILNNLNAVKVGHVAGDLVAKNLSDALSIQRVDGDIGAYS